MASNVPSQPPLAGKDGDIDFERAFIEQQSMAHGYTGNMFSRETTSQKVKRLFKEDPMVPIGLGTITAVLGYGMYAFASGKSLVSQSMMRYRVLAQGGVVLAVCYSMYAKMNQQKEAEARLTGEARAHAPKSVDRVWFLANAVEANTTTNSHLLSLDVEQAKP